MIYIIINFIKSLFGIKDEEFKKEVCLELIWEDD
jgi:hypothetical protein